MAADKRENSVLFSLRELRQIEEDRVRQEENLVRQKVEDERRAKEDEIRRAREEEERRQRAAEEAERARLEEEQRRIREEELRLEEAERKHRIEAQSRLEEQRLRMEIEAKSKMASNKRIKVLMGLAGGMLVLVAGLGIYAVNEKKERDRQALLAQAEIERREAQLVQFKQDLDRELEMASGIRDQIDKDVAELERTHDEEGRKRLRAAIAAKQAEFQRSQERQRAIRDRAEAARKAPVSVKCANPNDPLCGVN
jgi:colicin import membrane protein